MRVNAVRVHGTKSAFRSVGYRLLLRHRTEDGWQTTQRGALQSAPASRSSAAHLPGTSIRLDRVKSGPYRAVVKVIWWDETADVQGVQVAAIEHHWRSFDRSIGTACRASVSTAES